MTRNILAQFGFFLSFQNTVANATDDSPPKFAPAAARQKETSMVVDRRLILSQNDIRRAEPNS